MKHRFFLLTIILMVCFCACKNEKNNISTPQIPQTEVEINKLINTEPDNAELYFTKASILIEKGDYKGAIKDLQKATQLTPSNAKYTHALADTHFDNEEYDLAVSTLNKYITNYPKSTNTKLKLSEYLLILKKHEDSQNIIQSIIKDEPQNAEAYFMLGCIYQDQQKNIEAIDALQSAVENNPELVEGWIMLGNLHERSDSKKALQYFDNAINVDPNNPKPLHSKAYLLQNTGKIKDAINIYKQINVKHPDYIPSFLNTGILYMELDSLTQAKEHFNVIVQQYPQNPVGYHYLAIAEAKEGNKTRAIQLAENALQLDPDYKEAEEFIKDITK